MASRFRGHEASVTLQVENWSAVARLPAFEAPEIGARVRVGLDPRYCAVFR
jgi:hypothetical protein